MSISSRNQSGGVKSPPSLEVMTDRVASRGRNGIQIGNTMIPAQIASTHAYTRPRRSTADSQNNVERIYRDNPADNHRPAGNARNVSTSRVRRQSLQHPVSRYPTLGTAENTESNNTPSANDEIFSGNGHIVAHTRLSTSPSSQTVMGVAGTGPNYPPELKNLLDGTRNSDELGVIFEASWPKLEKFLKAIGDGNGSGDFGHVVIIYH